MIPKVCNACGHDPELDSAEVRALRTAVKLAESALATAREEGRAAGAEEMRERAAMVVGAAVESFPHPRQLASILFLKDLFDAIRSLATTPAPEPAAPTESLAVLIADIWQETTDGGFASCNLSYETEKRIRALITSGVVTQRAKGEPAVPTPGEGKP